MFRAEDVCKPDSRVCLKKAAEIVEDEDFNSRHTQQVKQIICFFVNLLHSSQNGEIHIVTFRNPNPNI